ncbi:hypothetical protein Tco_1175207 [Tanacetum coccineum]
MDDMIKEKLALKQQIDSLEQNLFNQIKEKESLLQTFTVSKMNPKKGNIYMAMEIDLEKIIKELDNIIYKVGQFAQTVHMLTKPQVFNDNTHKQALGYQNPFYLKKAQRIKPTLYDGSVISSQHVAMPVIDDEETLILEEVSRSKMLAKQNDPILKEKKVNTTLINYVELNKLSEDFGKRFVPQQELSAEQAFWFHMSNPTTKSSDASPVNVEAPSELPKVSLVNESLKKLKFHLAKFDSVVKIRTTPDALTEGFKDQFDSIKKTRVRTKEQSDSLIAKLNLKYVENKDLKAQIQDKGQGKWGKGMGELVSVLGRWFGSETVGKGGGGFGGKRVEVISMVAAIGSRQVKIQSHMLILDRQNIKVKEFQRSFCHADTERLSQSDEVLKLKNFKKDVFFKLSRPRNNKSMSMSVQKSQVHKTTTRSQDDDKRLCLVDDLKEVQVHI